MNVRKGFLSVILILFWLLAGCTVPETESSTDVATDKTDTSEATEDTEETDTLSYGVLRIESDIYEQHTWHISIDDKYIGRDLSGFTYAEYGIYQDYYEQAVTVGDHKLTIKETEAGLGTWEGTVYVPEQGLTFMCAIYTE